MKDGPVTPDEAQFNAIEYILADLANSFARLTFTTLVDEVLCNSLLSRQLAHLAADHAGGTIGSVAWLFHNNTMTGYRDRTITIVLDKTPYQVRFDGSEGPEIVWPYQSKIHV